MKKTVLVTGAAGGIGAAIAEKYGSEGYNVVVHYNSSQKRAENLAEHLRANGAQAMAVKADITENAQVERMFAQIKEVFGSVDILINNAGISEFCLFTDLTEIQWDRMFQVNCKGAFLCSKYALADMIHKKQGGIVNISSMWGQVGASCEVHYSASKAAMIGMTKALAKEVGPSNIRVNCIAPGVIDTDMNQSVSVEVLDELKNETPLMRIGTPEDVAELAYFLTSEGAAFLTGQVIGANGGFII